MTRAARPVLIDRLVVTLASGFVAKLREFCSKHLAAHKRSRVVRVVGQLGSRITYYGGGGPNQSGRYASLGSDYYHKATIGSRWITNHSNSKSGDLSFELWAMRYYGATSGIVLMTRGLNPLYGGSYYSRVERSGHAVFLDRFRFPELDLWEFTRNGWKWRDALTFTKKDLL